MIMEWLGTATFRLTIGELVVFLDAYMDRVPAAPPVELSAKDVLVQGFPVDAFSLPG
jgi:L-ascorbate metabolism protein UlaG (beta-lactamase superfamily)